MPAALHGGLQPAWPHLCLLLAPRAAAQPLLPLCSQALQGRRPHPPQSRCVRRGQAGWTTWRLHVGAQGQGFDVLGRTGTPMQPACASHMQRAAAAGMSDQGIAVGRHAHMQPERPRYQPLTCDALHLAQRTVRCSLVRQHKGHGADALGIQAQVLCGGRRGRRRGGAKEAHWLVRCTACHAGTWPAGWAPNPPHKRYVLLHTRSTCTLGCHACMRCMHRCTHSRRAGWSGRTLL